MVQERLDFCAAEKVRASFAVEVDVLLGPVAVALGGARAEVAALAGDGDAVKKAGGLAVAGGFVTP